MAKVHESQEFGVSADDMWERIGDFHRLDWHPAVEKTDSLDGGARRLLYLAGGGGTILETLLEEGDRSYSYDIVESPLPVANYRATIQVGETDGGCIVDWEATFEPVGVDEAEAVETIQGIFRAGLGNL